MKKSISILLVLFLFFPCLIFAGWSQPVWTDDCNITVQKDKDGRMSIWTEICYGQDAKQTQKKIETYNYYNSGEVKEINQKVYDAKDSITSDKTVTHYKDGKYPTTENNIKILE